MIWLFAIFFGWEQIRLMQIIGQSILVYGVYLYMKALEN